MVKDVVIDFPTRESIRELMESGNYTQADQVLSFLQAAFERGGVSDEQLEKAFSAFEYYLPKLSPALEEWVENKPDSYVARLARAKWLYAKAGHFRGGGLAREIKPDDMDIFRACLRRAYEDLTKSLTLTAKPILSHVKLMDIAVIGGGDIDDHYQAALSLYPESLTARRSKMWSLRQEWGGSHEAMKAYVESDQHALLNDEEKLRLQARLHEAKAHWLLYFEKDEAQAEVSLNKSLGIKRTPFGVFKLALLTYGNNKSEALKLFEEAYRLDPLDTDKQTRYGLTLYELAKSKQQKDKATQLIREAANWGDRFAMALIEDIDQMNTPTAKFFTTAGKVWRFTGTLLKWAFRVVLVLLVLFAIFWAWVIFS